jgi:hypothetical protein
VGKQEASQKVPKTHQIHTKSCRNQPSNNS